MLLACLLARDLSTAYRLTKEARATIEFAFAFMFAPEHYFYDALIRLSFRERNPQEFRESPAQLVTINQEKLAKAAASGPVNYRCKFLLVNAEVARLEKRPLEAMNLYEEAIALAHENAYTNNEALACELAGKLQYSMGNKLAAKNYLKDACRVYHIWGCSIRMESLQQSYPEFFTEVSEKWNESPSVESDIQIDLHSVIKSSHVLAEEI